MEKRMAIYVLLPIVIISVIIAIWTLVKSSNWLPTDGIIKEIEIIEKYNRPDTAMSENRKSFEYILNLKYIYTVNNHEYTGTQLFAGLPNVFDNKKDAEDILIKYPKDSSTNIYYDPSNPGNSSLITSSSFNKKGIVTLIVLVLFISLFVAGGISLYPKL